MEKRIQIENGKTINTNVRVLSMYPFCSSSLYDAELSKLYLDPPEDNELLRDIQVDLYIDNSSNTDLKYFFVPYDLDFRRKMQELDIPFVTVVPKIKAPEDMYMFMGYAYTNYICHRLTDDRSEFEKIYPDWALDHCDDGLLFKYREENRDFTGIGTVKCGIGYDIESDTLRTGIKTIDIFPLIETLYRKYFKKQIRLFQAAKKEVLKNQ